jgi:hypothetical protein
MASELLSVFLDVVAPVFAIVAIGYLIGPRLGLDARTLSRAAYYVFVPAFTFDVISRSRVPLASAGRMAAYAVVTHLAFGALAFLLARLLRRSREPPTSPSSRGSGSSARPPWPGSSPGPSAWAGSSERPGSSRPACPPPSSSRSSRRSTTSRPGS